MEDTQVMPEDELQFSVEFGKLLEDEHIADPRVWADVEVYDEVPLYSRLSQLSFLKGLSIADQNRQLIRAAVRQLDVITKYFESHEDGRQLLRLVSIIGWWADAERGGGRCMDGTDEVIQPYLWIGNMRHERMREFKVYRPRSRCASFVSRAVNSTDYSVFESNLDEMTQWCPDRVYVGRTDQTPGEVVF
jgi:hypothetical protein